MFRNRWDRAAEHDEREALRAAFREALIANRIAVQVDGAISGTAWRSASVESINLGPPVQLRIRMLPGQLPADVAQIGHRVAPALGGRQLSVADLGHGFADITVLNSDPLADTMPLVLPRYTRTVLLGRTANGDLIEEDWHKGAHAAIQGVTRSGKSILCYGILSQLAWQRDVIVGGVDHTSLLLRPFADTRHAEWQSLGGDFGTHQAVLERIVGLMDQRIGDLPADRDAINISQAQPLIAVTLEEFPGLLARAKTHGNGKEIAGLIERLLCEGAKVGIRVIILVQRAEANVMGSVARSMCSLRISFRTDNAASLALLHEGVDPQVAAQHTRSAPGICLISRPGEDLTRARGPFLGDYSAYRRAVLAACAGDAPAGPALRVVS